jgi:nucleoside-diphosphate-sugar epimerase
MLLVVNEKAEGEVVNIGNDYEITIIEVVNRIKEVTKCSSLITFHPLPKDDPKRRCPDISKLGKLVGWRPRVSFEEGLKRTTAWFSQNK